VALAYDADGLLIALQVVDCSPLINLVDPMVEPQRGWFGDSLQIRLIADADVEHPVPESLSKSDTLQQFAIWYFTDKEQPAVDIRYGMDAHGSLTLIGPKSGFAFRKENASYTMEGRIPWSLLKCKAPPQPGQRWIFTIQPNWGDEKGDRWTYLYDCVLNEGAAYRGPVNWGYACFIKPSDVTSKLAEQQADEARIFARPIETVGKTIVPVKYTNPAEGFVSMAICKKDGWIVRTLLTKAKRGIGLVTEKWDGLDDDGKPVPPGEYILKALTHPGIEPKFITSVHNSGNPPWGNHGRYSWGGDHGNPIGAASDPQGNTYLLWTSNEAGNSLICVDAKGQSQWGASIPWGEFDGCATAIAYDQGMLYVAEDGMNFKKAPLNQGGLLAYDAQTGRRANFANGAGKLLVTEWKSSLRELAVETGTIAERMKGGKFTVADNTEEIQGRNRLVTSNLSGVAATPDRLYCSLYLENKIVALDKATCKVVDSFEVQCPSGLAYDAAARHLYIISGHSIMALNPSDRKVTVLVSQGLEYPYGLALDGDGRVWVSVRGRQMQVLCFDPSGKLIKKVGKTGGRPWVGKYDPSGMLMPAGISVDQGGQLWVTEQDRTPKRISLWNTKDGDLIKEFFGSASYSPMMASDPEKPEEVYIHNTRFLVDYESGTVKPDAVVYRKDYDGPALPGPQACYAFMGATFEISSYQGKRFAFDGHGGVYAYGCDRFKPLLYIGQGFDGIPAELPKGLRQQLDCAYVWADKNKNGLLEKEEIRLVAPKRSLWSHNSIGFGGHFFPGATFIRGGKIFRPMSIDKDGVPVYPQPEAVPEIFCGQAAAYHNRSDFWPSLKSDWKEFYALVSERGSDQVGDGKEAVIRFASNGNIRWEYRRTAVAFGLKAGLPKTGDLFGALRIVGEIALPDDNGGEILGVGCYGGYYGFLSEDGLFIDTVGNRKGGSTTFDFLNSENFSGYFFRHCRTGKIYLFCGDSDGRILELQGFDKIRRFDAGSVTLTEDQYEAIRNENQTSKKKEGEGTICMSSGIPALDEALKGWDPAKWSSISVDENSRAQVGLAYDQNNLYAVFKVQDSTPWKNTSGDWRFLFKGGDAVDIQIGAVNPAPAGGRREIQPGDVRVMLAPAPEGDGVLAVGMWPKAVPGMTPELQTYKSPAGEVTFERVAQLKGVTAKVQKQSDGYTLQAVIPWVELGMKAPSRNSQLQGDVGVLFSDAGGANTILRRYFFNDETVIVNDIPSEVRITTSKWGLIRVE